MPIFVNILGVCEELCHASNENNCLYNVKRCLESKGHPVDSFYVVNNGRLVSDDDRIVEGSIYHVVPRLLGGKGGFGSMLRAIGAQIEKTTNHEACRDISGRRLRDVNNEKKLKEWIGKKAERENELEQKRKDRLAKRRALPNHKFDDPLYEEQRNKVAENLDEALQTGLQKSLSGASATITSTDVFGTRKRSSSTPAEPSSQIKRACEWLGIDVADVSDLSSEETDSEESSRDSRSEAVESGESSKVSIEITSTPDVADSLGSFPEETDSKEKTAVKSNSNTKCGLLAQLPPPVNAGNDLEKKIETHKQVDPSEVKLENFNSIEELEELGLDNLKSVLLSRGLKCGGTLNERAQRLFSVKGLSQEEIPPSLFSKSASGKGKKK